MTTTALYDVTTKTLNDITNHTDVTIREQYATGTSAHDGPEDIIKSSMTSPSTIAMTTIYDVHDDGIFKTVTLGGSIAAIVIYFCVVGLLFGIGMRGIRSHIHCNVCLTLMTSHVLLLIGADREAESTSCKIVSMVTQFTILVGLTWLMLEGIHLFHISMVGSDISTKKRYRRKVRKRRKVDVNSHHRYRNIQRHRNRGQNRGNSVIEDERREITEENNNRNDLQTHRETQTGNLEQYKDDAGESQPNKSPICSRLLSYYIIGWIGPAMFIGATVPAALHGYGKSENCWLATQNEIIWVFGAPVPAIFIFHCLATILAISNYKAKIKQREESVKAAERAKLIAQRQRERQERIRAVLDAAANRTPTPPICHRISPLSQREGDVGSKRHNVQRTIAQSSSDDESNGSSKNTYRYVRLRNRYKDIRYEDYNNEGYENNVLVHPPVYEVTQRTLAVSVPEDEANEPVSNYLVSVYWNMILMPLVSATWSIGIIAINFRLVPLIYIFCGFNIFQALYIFAFYCVVTFRMRQKWFIMTSQEINTDARPVTIMLGDNSDDESQLANGRRTRKKIPNIELMLRTPTPFVTAPLMEHQSEYSNDLILNSSTNIRYSEMPELIHDHNSLSKSVEVTPFHFQRKKDKQAIYASLPNVTAFGDDVRQGVRYGEFLRDLQVKRKNPTLPSRVTMDKTTPALVAKEKDLPGHTNIRLTSSGQVAISSYSVGVDSKMTPPDAAKSIDLSDRTSFQSAISGRFLEGDINSILGSKSAQTSEEINAVNKNEGSYQENQRPKVPLVKSLSDKNIFKNPRQLRPMNSFPASTSARSSIDIKRSEVELNKLISNEPFHKTTSNSQMNDTISISTVISSSSRGSASVADITPPMMVEEDKADISDSISVLAGDISSILDTTLGMNSVKDQIPGSYLRKTYNLDSDSNSPNEPYRPKPRRQSHKFSSIPIQLEKNDILKIKSKNLNKSEKLEKIFKK